MSALQKTNHDIVKSVAKRLCWKCLGNPETEWKEYETLAKEAVLEVAEWLDEHTSGAHPGMKLRAMVNIERKVNEANL